MGTTGISRDIVFTNRDQHHSRIGILIALQGTEHHPLVSCLLIPPKILKYQGFSEQIIPGHIQITKRPIVFHRESPTQAAEPGPFPIESQNDRTVINS